MAGATDVGRKRKANQDSLFYDEDFGVGIVADGIGGRNGGEVASSMAVGGLRQAFIDAGELELDDLNPFLQQTIEQINKAIIKKGRQNKEIKGMGTTLNALVFRGNILKLAHIGDSRTYLYSEKNLFQLTIDHNVKTFLERGWLSPSKVLPGSTESALVRALGLFLNCEIDIYEKTVQPGEIFLTSSDGLFDMINDSEIAKIIGNNLENFEQIPALLIEAANKNGGRDNITVLLSKVVED